MDSIAKLYLERADNQLILARVNFEISTNSELKKQLGIPNENSFLNNVISESYYGIFYAAKSFLLTKNIITKVPNEHKKTYLKFKRLVNSGLITKELLEIYSIESEKAEVLLNIFFEEKKKRGKFTYHIQSQANILSAEESINNCRKFIATLKLLFH